MASVDDAVTTTDEGCAPSRIEEANLGESNDNEAVASSVSTSEPVTSGGQRGGREEKEEEISSSTSIKQTKQRNPENVFAQPMLPPPGPPKVSSSGSVATSSADSSSGSSRSRSLSSSAPRHKEKISQEKLDKYNAILSSINYHPPTHGATVADSRYNLEVLKNGTIVDSVTFSAEENKGYYVVGRVPGCDVVAENPTVSRLHAVLQFVKCSGDSSASKGNQDDPQETGLYLYDLKSTHGTFINKNQVFPYKFYRVRVGHVIKFGTSQRMYIVGGPSEDEEEESDKSVSELMNEKLQKDLERKQLEEEEQLKREAISSLSRNVEEEGISWGMAEDADEESDMRVNPFAMDYEASELALDNPKKSLRSWFEREGHELEYEVREKGNGQYVCRIGLPLDGPTDAPVYAESEVKMKKKEAAHDAAMKACQILDSHGLLRTSNQETKKRKEKRLEDEDYYSSDDDTFLDRTGSVEKKREKRLRIAGKIEEKVETYESLRSKHSELEAEVAEIQSKINKSKHMKANPDEDVDIDDYMNMLKTGVLDTKKLKSRLKEATDELQRTKKLMDIAKPAELPSYLKNAAKHEPSASSTAKSAMPADNPASTVQTPTLPSSDPIASSTSTNAAPETDTTAPQKSPPQKQPRAPIVGPMIPGVVPTRKSLFGLIKPSQLAALKQPVLRPPDSRPAPTSPEVKEASSEEESDEEAANPESLEESNEASSSVPLEMVQSQKKRKRQRHRNQQKKHKPEGYDQNDPNYSVWVPPSNQKGDGKTSLNEKLGY